MHSKIKEQFLYFLTTTTSMCVFDPVYFVLHYYSFMLFFLFRDNSLTIFFKAHKFDLYKYNTILHIKYKHDFPINLSHLIRTLRNLCRG